MGSCISSAKEIFREGGGRCVTVPSKTKVLLMLFRTSGLRATGRYTLPKVGSKETFR
jgi:hypothetical protein